MICRLKEEKKEIFVVSLHSVGGGECSDCTGSNLLPALAVNSGQRSHCTPKQIELIFGVSVTTMNSKGVRRKGLTGLKPLPKSPEKNYLLIQTGAFYVSQFIQRSQFHNHFYNNRLYKRREREVKGRFN